MKKKIRLIKRVENIQEIESKKIKILKKAPIDCSLSLEEIKEHFYEPVKKLIENDGYNDDAVMIADVNGAAVIMQILESIMGLRKSSDGEILNLIQILEENAFQDEEIIENEIEEHEDEDEDEEIETSKIKDYEEQDYEDNEEEEEEEEDGKDEEEEEMDYEDDCEEYKECDVYMENVSDDSMDDY
jgi:hypothetical protein